MPFPFSKYQPRDPLGVKFYQRGRLICSAGEMEKIRPSIEALKERYQRLLKASKTVSIKKIVIYLNFYYFSYQYIFKDKNIWDYL